LRAVRAVDPGSSGRLHRPSHFGRWPDGGAVSAPANPFAFPSPDDGRPSDGYGMDLRDWFAGQALNAVLRDCGSGAKTFADVAYSIADAMLAARAVKKVQPSGLETEQAAPGTGGKLLTIARDFIDKHHVSCAEATSNDGVYEDAPLLVEALADVVGYYSYPEDAA